MSGYIPLKIASNSTGLVQSRENFLLPEDAYPQLINAFVWRERIKRKQGYQLLGRLQRTFTNVNRGFAPPATTYDLLTVTGYITNITQAVSAVVTTRYPHNLIGTGTVTLTGVQGMTAINQLNQAYTVLSPTTFSVSTDSTLFAAYTSGGIFVAADSLITLQPNAELVPGSVIVKYQAGPDIVFTDNGAGGLVSVTPFNSGTINYISGFVTITTTAPNNTPLVITYSYTTGMPVMGLRDRELTATNNEQMVAFDQVYAYKFVGASFVEFLPGTTWTGSNSDFFWSTNYWVGDGNLKIFWVTNFKDPIRYTNGVVGTNWIDFSPVISLGSGNRLQNCLVMLPFRGRMVVFNTIEQGAAYSNRIRWSAIGNPFSDVSAIVTTVNVKAWYDDVRGQGGFLDIPTSEAIMTVGFVRDNLVIYCERSTWQLRYTGRSIAPFQIEKVNTELGVESTFSGVQFDTSLVGVGDKGIVECDSFKSERIDIKIPDLVMLQINNLNEGTKRVHGIRDFKQRLAFWIYPETASNGIFPDRRLCYNYENDSWAIFTDSLTVLGTYQAQTSRTWATSKFSWADANFSWGDRPALFPNIMGGNQQGFVLYLDKITTNKESLYISAITGNTTIPTVITSPNHNLQTGYVIQIIGIPSTTGYANLNAGIDPSTNLPYNANNGIFGVVVGDNANTNAANTFRLMIYNPATGEFSTPQLDAPASYIGGGLIRVRDNFSIVSKRFNYMDQGKQYQLGYIDILMDKTEEGAFTLNVYNDYQDYTASNASNQTPLNASDDTFFNQTIETSSLNSLDGGAKNWKRVFCATNSNFVTLEYTLSNEQMTNICQESDVQVDAQVIWSRVGGRLQLNN